MKSLVLIGLILFSYLGIVHASCEVHLRQWGGVTLDEQFEESTRDNLIRALQQKGFAVVSDSEAADFSVSYSHACVLTDGGREPLLTEGGFSLSIRNSEDRYLWSSTSITNGFRNSNLKYLRAKRRVLRNLPSCSELLQM